MYFCALLLQCFKKQRCDVTITNLNITPSVIVQGLCMCIAVLFLTCQSVLCVN